MSSTLIFIANMNLTAELNCLKKKSNLMKMNKEKIVYKGKLYMHVRRYFFIRTTAQVYSSNESLYSGL